MVFTASETDVVVMLILEGPLPLEGRGALDQGMVNLGPAKISITTTSDFD